MAQFLQFGLGFDPLDAGLRPMPWERSSRSSAGAVGARIPRLGERPFIVTGMTLQAVAMAWIGLVAQHTQRYWPMVTPCCCPDSASPWPYRRRRAAC